MPLSEIKNLWNDDVSFFELNVTIDNKQPV